MKIQASIKALPNSFKNREENYKLVDEALVIIIRSGLEYVIGPSETTVEGERDSIMDLLREIQDYYYDNKISFSLFITFEYNIDNFYIDGKKKI